MSTCSVLTLVICVLTASVLPLREDDLTCVAPHITPVKVSVNSRKNLTGHWTSKVGLEYRGPLSHRGTTVNVEHSTVPCVGADPALNILLTFTASTNEEAMNTKDDVSNVTNGYELFPAVGIYKYHPDATNWTRAREICADEGAHLVIINSEKESNLLVSLIKRYKGSSPWIGVHRIGEEYYTIHGKNLNTTGFTRWSPSEPDRGSSYCLYMNNVNGGIADNTCDTRLPFICEQDKR